jgi:hypothetical protein
VAPCHAILDRRVWFQFAGTSGLGCEPDDAAGRAAHMPDSSMAVCRKFGIGSKSRLQSFQSIRVRFDGKTHRSAIAATFTPIIATTIEVVPNQVPSFQNLGDGGDEVTATRASTIWKFGLSPDRKRPGLKDDQSPESLLPGAQRSSCKQFSPPANQSADQGSSGRGPFAPCKFQRSHLHPF